MAQQPGESVGRLRASGAGAGDQARHLAASMTTAAGVAPAAPGGVERGQARVPVGEGVRRGRRAASCPGGQLEATAGAGAEASFPAERRRDGNATGTRRPGGRWGSVRPPPGVRSSRPRRAAAAAPHVPAGAAAGHLLSRPGICPLLPVTRRVVRLAVHRGRRLPATATPLWRLHSRLAAISQPAPHRPGPGRRLAAAPAAALAGAAAGCAGLLCGGAELQGAVAEQRPAGEERLFLLGRLLGKSRPGARSRPTARSRPGRLGARARPCGAAAAAPGACRALGNPPCVRAVRARSLGFTGPPRQSCCHRDTFAPAAPTAKSSFLLLGSNKQLHFC